MREQETLRRKILVHEVTLSAKQVVQLNERYALERGTHLILSSVTEQGMY